METFDYYQPLFNLMVEEHGKTLLIDEMEQIINVVKKMIAVEKVEDVEENDTFYEHYSESCPNCGKYYMFDCSCGYPLYIDTEDEE